MSRPVRLVKPEDRITTVMISMRGPLELKERLEAAAKAEDRTLSQECVRRLRLSFECQCRKSTR